MLAESFDDKRLSRMKETDPLWLSPKLNGIRAVWDGKTLKTRTGIELVSVPHIVEELKKHFDGTPLDGEIYKHGMRFQDITEITGTSVNVDKSQLEYWLYDIPVPNVSFDVRHEMMLQYIGISKYIKVLEQKRVTVFEFMQMEEKNIYASEYEGTMIRTNADYQNCRTFDLMKLKDFIDAEAVVIGVTQKFLYEKIVTQERVKGSRKKASGGWSKNGKALPQEAVGALRCRLPSGVEFKIGTGFDHKLAKEWWKNPPIGKVVNFQYQELSKAGVPIVPSFEGFRYDV